jgi:YHS domain-containing protein
MARAERVADDRTPTSYERSQPMAQDKVCGMQVDEKQAAAKSEYDGATYYFCSLSCKAKFDKEPAKYAAVPKGA